MQLQAKNLFYCFEEYKWRVKLRGQDWISGRFVDFSCESPEGVDTHYPDGAGKQFAFCAKENILEFVGLRRIHRAVYPDYVILFDQADVEALELEAF